MKTTPTPISSKVFVAVDTLIFSVIRNQLRVLLIQIATGPYAGQWALPGGLVRLDESLDAAAERILSEKAGVDGLYLEQLAAFGDPARDNRERSISVAYFSLVNSEQYRPHTTEYYANIAWHSVNRLPELAFDHQAMIVSGRERLVRKLGESNIAYALLPKEFTLTELQTLYESVLGHTLDKRNFRKKIQALSVLTEITNARKEGANRPAKLYRFSEHRIRLAKVL